jgi:hypothetical protein
LTQVEAGVTLKSSARADRPRRCDGNTISQSKGRFAMAKALFGSIVAPHELRAAEEIAALRTKVRRLEAELAVLREERDTAIAHELLTLADDSANSVLA